MAMQTFAPSVTPDQGMQVEVEPPIIEIGFGDQYMQRAGDGVQQYYDKMAPRWTNARKVEADYIIDFLRAHKGRIPFYWVPSGESALRSIRCASFTYRWKKGNFCDIEARFEETAPQA